ncbi:MAG TPA: universal stress protein [Sandaracinaceae bacterium]
MSEASVWVPSCRDEASRAALRVARELARLEHATVHVVATKNGHAEAGAIVHEVDAEPERAVVDAVDESAMIVTTTRDSRDPPTVGLGRAARTVLSSARCPVVLVRPERGEAAWALEELLVPHDGTPTTSAAICPAAELARSVGARLFAIHVVSSGAPRGQEPGSLRVPHYVDQPQHEWPEWAGEFLERIRSQCPIDPSRLRLFLARGEPGGEILRIAEENQVDLIVLAWHGTLEPRHADVFNVLLRRAPCPLLVLRTEPGAPE